MRSVGFAIIVGHGVEAAIVNELYGKAKQFFGLSAEEKLKYWKGEFYGIGGYTPRGVEAASRTIEDEDKHAAVSGMHGQGDNTFII
jgi:isopenicillin N synthase-like dioxygenase